jgi:hypothetical protein
LGNFLKTQNVATLFSPALGPNMVAWVLVIEGWTASADSAGEAELLQALDEHRVHERPDAQKVRMVIAVDRIGARYQVQRVGRDAPTAYLDEYPDKTRGVFGAMTTLMDNTP